MLYQRLELHIDDETLQRIEGAAQHDSQSVTEFCMTAIKTWLAIRERQNGIATGFVEWPEGLLDEMAALRAAILEQRGGRSIDIDAVMEQMRDERDAHEA